MKNAALRGLRAAFHLCLLKRLNAQPGLSDQHRWCCLHALVGECNGVGLQVPRL